MPVLAVDLLHPICLPLHTTVQWPQASHGEHCLYFPVGKDSLGLWVNQKPTTCCQG